MIQPLNLSNDAQTQAEPAKANYQSFKLILLATAVIALGTASGWGIYSVTNRTPKQLKSAVNGIATAGETYGVDDTKAFTDSAEGELADGGIDGEGSHHLIREGGESQFVYLTSSVINLDQFIGRQVKVWGQTFEAQKAGWLMDVGRLEVKK